MDAPPTRASASTTGFSWLSSVGSTKRSDTFIHGGSGALADQIIEEIQAARVAFYAARSKQYALSTTAKLPPEMLMHIFEFHAIDYPPEVDPDVPLGWMTVTHVCRVWRLVALEYSSLWYRIAFELGPGWASRMAERAKCTPLVIQTCVDPIMTPAHVERSPLMPSMSGNTRSIYRASVTSVLPKHLSHTKELVLHGNAQEFHPVSYTLFGSAPILDRLVLVCNGRGPAPGTAISTYPVIPPSFRAPSLKTIMLHNVVFSWSSFSSSNLSSIDLQFVTNPSIPPAVTLSPADSTSSSLFINSLNTMTNLEYLLLHGVIPLPSSTENVVELPKLKKLSLTSSATLCLGFWNAIRIPPLAKLHISCTNSHLITDEPGSPRRTLLSSLSIYLRSPARNTYPIRTLVVTCPHRGSIMLSGWHRYRSKAEAQDVFNQLGDPDVLLRFDWTPLHVVNPVGLNVNGGIDKPALFRTLPLQGLRALKIDLVHLDATWTKSLWVNLFMPSKDVRHVAVDHGGACTFCQALVTVDDALQPQSEGGGRRKPIRREAVFLPRLSSLAFTNVDFDVMAVQGQPFYQNLHRWLAKRKKVKAAVKYARLEFCKIERHQVSMLEDVVQELHWIGLGVNGGVRVFSP